jgi:hypothetical protein
MWAAKHDEAIQKKTQSGSNPPPVIASRHRAAKQSIEN